MTDQTIPPYVSASKSLALLQQLAEVAKMRPQSKDLENICVDLEKKTAESIKAYIDSEIIVSYETLQQLLLQNVAEISPESLEQEEEEPVVEPKRKKHEIKRKVSKRRDDDDDDSDIGVPFIAPGMKLADPDIEANRLSPKDTFDVRRKKLNAQLDIAKKKLEEQRKNFALYDAKIPQEKYALRDKEVANLMELKVKIEKEMIDSRKTISAVQHMLEELEMDQEKANEKSEMKRFLRNN